MFDSDGYAVKSLAVFGTVQGKTIDTTGNPYRDGTDTGLKEKKVDISKINKLAANDIRGVDISSYEALKNAGVKYYDFEGKEQPLMKVLAENGVNYIRLRIWNDPKNAEGKYYGGGNNDVATDLKIAKEAHQYGMKVLLCFHYSDSWADPNPSGQILPKAWEKDKGNTEKLSDDVYNFTYDTVKKFTDAGVDVGMVQVGNEITKGFLDGFASNWQEAWTNSTYSDRNNAYLKAGSKAVRKAAPNALVAIHLETPDANKYRTIMDSWKKAGVDYDVLGSSYYPLYGYGSNNPTSLKAVQDEAAKDGKLFVVLETAGINSVEDADGTGNNIGSDQLKNPHYPVGPQGQVDELEDMYKTIVDDSNDNGLGAFYWEPAWIPVHAGWKNWKENKEASEEYGTGWINSNAKGYVPDSKLYYNGKPTWGGTSWDNATLFDDLGYPLQSLKFYKDAVGNEKGVKLVKVRYVDQDGKEIAKPTYKRIPVVSTATIKAAKVANYTAEASSKKVKGDKADMATVTFTYLDSNKMKNDPNGVLKKGHISKNVQVYKNNYKVYKNFKWKKAKVNAYKQKYVVKYYYKLNSGRTYYSLYSPKTKQWVGYINANATKSTTLQGKAHSYKRAVKVVGNYQVYKNFDWQAAGVNALGKTYYAKYYYSHANGRRYYSLYDAKTNKWVGYINAKGTKATTLQGKAHSYKKTVKITRNYKVYRNFNWKKSSTQALGHKYYAKYYYNHANGYRYYSLYTSKHGKWVGYINSKAVK